MYLKIGKFKPGDVIKGSMNYNGANTLIAKVLSIKRRRNGCHRYKIRYQHIDDTYMDLSQEMSFIDNRFELSLKQIMKNL